MAGRTTKNWMRLYADGYNLSSQALSVGELAAGCDFEALAALSEPIKGGLCGAPEFTIGDVNGVFDNTATTGLHILSNSWLNSAHDIMVAIGDRAEPAVGVPAFVGKWVLKTYKGVPSGVMVTATLGFGGYDGTDRVSYNRPWGHLVHAYGAETGANASNTPNVDNGGSTALGGYLAYQIFAYAGTGSATISIDDSANGTSWLALSGATTGAIAHTSMPCGGIVQLGTTATVRQYLRWQLSLATLTSCTFALAFVRGLS